MLWQGQQVPLCRQTPQTTDESRSLLGGGGCLADEKKSHECARDTQKNILTPLTQINTKIFLVITS